MPSSLKVKKKKPIRNIGRCDSACLTAAKSLRWREPLYFSATEQKRSWRQNQSQQTSCWNRLCGCGRVSSFTTHKLFFDAQGAHLVHVKLCKWCEMMGATSFFFSQTIFWATTSAKQEREAVGLIWTIRGSVTSNRAAGIYWYLKTLNNKEKECISVPKRSWSYAGIKAWSYRGMRQINGVHFQHKWWKSSCEERIK